MADQVIRPLRILIVEDEAIGAMYLRATLERMGHRVIGVEESGEGAIAKGLAERPDRVLMDIRLKGELDGISAARRLWETVGVPSVFVTAYGRSELNGRYQLPKGAPVLIKPDPTKAATQEDSEAMK